MDFSDVYIADLKLHSEECGEEVGYPDVEIVGLYSNQNETCCYYIDSTNQVVLDVFPIINQS